MQITAFQPGHLLAIPTLLGTAGAWGRCPYAAAGAPRHSRIVKSKVVTP